MVRSRVEQGPALRAGSLALVATLALLATACGGGEQHAPIPPLTPESKRPPVPATHAPALAYVRQCQRALAKLPVAQVEKQAARAVAKRTAQTIVACGNSDRLQALVNKNRADSSVDEAYLGEIAVFYALGNYQKYVNAVVAGKKGPLNVFDLAREQLSVGKDRLAAAVTELPYPPP